MSDLSSNPLLASLNDINRTTSIVFTFVYVIFFFAFFIKIFRQKTHRYVIFLFILLSLVRIAAFASRAVIAHHNKDGESTSRDMYIASAVLLIAGYMFVLEALCTLTVHWTFELRGRPLTGFPSMIFGIIEHVVLLLIMSLGIVGAVNEFQTDITPSKLQHAKHERVASGVLFVIVLIVIIFVILCGSVRAARQARLPPPPKLYQMQPAPPSTGLRTAGWLLVLAVCAFVEVIYRVWSSAKFQGWIVKEVAVDVLIFAPEVVAMLAILLVNFTELTSITFVGRRKRMNEAMPMGQVGV